MKLFKFGLVGLISIFVFSCFADAQSFPNVTKFLAPPYPPVAVAVRAEGDVDVLVEVNEKGKVTAATPIAGHKLLQAAAKFAALSWEFSSIPGTHYLTLKFLFRLPSPKEKERARIRGQYSLEFWTKYYRILNTPSYESPASSN